MRSSVAGNARHTQQLRTAAHSRRCGSRHCGRSRHVLVHSHKVKLLHPVARLDKDTPLAPARHVAWRGQMQICEQHSTEQVPKSIVASRLG